MSIRRVLERILAGVVGTCIAVYLAAVGVNAQVASKVSWWPYQWLWILAGVAALGGVLWLVVMLQHDRETLRRSAPVTKDLPQDLTHHARRDNSEGLIDTNTVSGGETVQSAMAKINQVVLAKAEFDAAADDSEFPPSKTGEVLYAHDMTAEKLTDGRWQITLAAHSKPCAWMTEISGGWSVIHVRSGYIGKFSTEQQAFDAVREQARVLGY